MHQRIVDKSLKIAIIGLGYVGVPTAVAFAEKGFSVVGVDKNEKVVNLINQKKSHISDLDIERRLKRVVEGSKLKATPNTSEAVMESDVILIIVPTPITINKNPDLTYIKDAGGDIAKGLRNGQLVILESTVYPGVTEEVLKPILEKCGLKAGNDFGLAYCPERYNPGDSDHTIERVARIVGGITPEWGRIAQRLYQTIIEEEVMLVENIKTAEAAKVIENIQRDLNIALINELALIFERLDIDIIDIINAASTKWNFYRCYPGGVGGHCLPVDPYYLIKKAKEVGYHAKIITAGRSINNYVPEHIFNLLDDALNEYTKPIKNSKVIILGFSYKANVGDPRESPSLKLIEMLKRKGADIIIIDPYIDNEYLKLYGRSEKDVYKASKNADALVLMTDHDEFLKIDLKRIKKLMNTPIIIDGRRLFDPRTTEEMGFYYRGIGRGNIENTQTIGGA